jgi:hypothetical protein
VQGRAHLGDLLETVLDQGDLLARRDRLGVRARPRTAAEMSRETTMATVTPMISSSTLAMVSQPTDDQLARLNSVRGTPTMNAQPLAGDRLKADRVGVPSNVWLSATPSLPRAMASCISPLTLRPRKRSMSLERATSAASRSTMLAVQLFGMFWAVKIDEKALGDC